MLHRYTRMVCHENAMDFRRTHSITHTALPKLLSFLLRRIVSNKMFNPFSQEVYKIKEIKTMCIGGCIEIDVDTNILHRIDIIVYIEIDRHFIPMKLSTCFSILLGIAKAQRHGK